MRLYRKPPTHYYRGILRFYDTRFAPERQGKNENPRTPKAQVGIMECSAPAGWRVLFHHEANKERVSR